MVWGGPQIGPVEVTSGPAVVYSKFELAFNITPSSGSSYSNPYDPEIIQVYLFNLFFYLFIEIRKICGI